MLSTYRTSNGEYSVQKERKEKANKVLSAFFLEVERIASNVLNDKIILRLTEYDQYKLYQLQIWSWRYKLSVEYTVTTLLLFWLARLPKHFKRRRGSLGLRVSTLVGVKSKEFLLDHLSEAFPNFEHEHEWKLQNIMTLVTSAGDRDVTAFTPEQFMVNYTARIYQSRRRIDKAKEKYSRRAFRDNPFLY